MKFTLIYGMAGAGMLFTACVTATGPLNKPGRISDAPEKYMRMINPEILTAEKLSYYQNQFLTKCARCHGEKGDGVGQDSGLMGVPMPNFSDPEFMKQIMDGEIYYQIENGGEDKSAMPAFGLDSAQGWSEEKIWNMVAYVRSLAASP
ncbi:MAG: cytochrome c [SAR324 cluster bacterium]|nr:cytochrome c [SAR324 cluster bacterium]